MKELMTHVLDFLDTIPLVIALPIVTFLGALSRDSYLVQETPELTPFVTALSVTLVVATLAIGACSICALVRHKCGLAASSLGGAIAISVSGIVISSLFPEIQTNTGWLVFMGSLVFLLCLFAVSIQMLSMKQKAGNGKQQKA